MVDWQTLGVGLPARDLAYFTATSLNPELRASDRRRPRRRLSPSAYPATGSPATTAKHAGVITGSGMLQALLISALGFAFAAATDRGDDMVLTMLGRGCQAIRELGTLELLR